MPLVPIACLPSVVDAAATELRRAFARAEVDTAKFWLQRCQADLAQLWHRGHLWAITEVQRGRSGLIVHIVAMAGQYDPSLIPEIEAWGKSQGCVRSIFTGRRGWQRILKSYRLRAITMEKEL